MARTFLLLAAAILACGSAERRPDVPMSKTVRELRRSAGGVQDCGDASESREERKCRTRPLGECLLRALKDCRPAHGAQARFSGEGDPIRTDWLVLSDGRGGCNLLVITDRTADPLGPKKLQGEKCEAIGWASHEHVGSCETPVAEGCKPLALRTE